MLPLQDVVVCDCGSARFKAKNPPVAGRAGRCYWPCLIAMESPIYPTRRKKRRKSYESHIYI